MVEGKNIIPKVDPHDSKTWVCPNHWHDDIKKFHGWEFDALRVVSEYLKESEGCLNTKLFIDDEDPGLMFLHVFRQKYKLGEVYVNEPTSNPKDKKESECYSTESGAVCYSVFSENDEEEEMHTLLLQEVKAFFTKDRIKNENSNQSIEDNNLGCA